jgi:hypothetical protein
MLSVSACSPPIDVPGHSYPYLEEVAPWNFAGKLALDGETFLLFEDGKQQRLIVAAQELPAEMFARFLNETGYGTNVPPVIVKLGTLYDKETGLVLPGATVTNVFIVDLQDSNPIRQEDQYIARDTGKRGLRGITVYGAAAFCRWYSSHTDISWHLPTPREWLGVANSRHPDLQDMPGGSLEWCGNPLYFGSYKKWPVMGGEWHLREKMTARGIAYELPTLRGEHEQPVTLRLFGVEREFSATSTNGRCYGPN